MKKIILLLLLSTLLNSCAYNYWHGKELEEEGRIEEANIEYHRAYTNTPSISLYQDAFERTAVLTSKDLIERYRNFLYLGKFKLAYDRLEKARALNPTDPEIQSELNKWTHVLLTGKVDFSFESLQNQVPLSDEMDMQVVLNSPNPKELLYVKLDPQTGSFAIDDRVYNANIGLLMNYSIHSIGIELIRYAPPSVKYMKFVDFKKPVPAKIEGSLSPSGTGTQSVEAHYPLELLKKKGGSEFWLPKKGIEFTAKLSGDRIKVGKTKNLDFLPQMLYLNQKDHRILLDFGSIEIQQKKIGTLWTYRRNLVEKRQYLKDIQKNILLKPFFAFREGAFPFVRE